MCPVLRVEISKPSSAGTALRNVVLVVASSMYQTMLELWPCLRALLKGKVTTYAVGDAHVLPCTGLLMCHATGT